MLVVLSSGLSFSCIGCLISQMNVSVQYTHGLTGHWAFCEDDSPSKPGRGRLFLSPIRHSHSCSRLMAVTIGRFHSFPPHYFRERLYITTVAWSYHTALRYFASRVVTCGNVPFLILLISLVRFADTIDRFIAFLQRFQQIGK